MNIFNRTSWFLLTVSPLGREKSFQNGPRFCQSLQNRCKTVYPELHLPCNSFSIFSLPYKPQAFKFRQKIRTKMFLKLILKRRTRMPSTFSELSCISCSICLFRKSDQSLCCFYGYDYILTAVDSGNTLSCFLMDVDKTVFGEK